MNSKDMNKSLLRTLTDEEALMVYKDGKNILAQYKEVAYSRIEEPQVSKTLLQEVPVI